MTISPWLSMSYFFIGTRPISDTMKMVKVIDQAIDPSSARLLESAQRQLDALRAAIGAKLVELDAALADPSRASSLAGLMTDLARLATTEAQAAATRACLQITSDSEARVLEADARSSSALEAERRATSDLQKKLEKSQKSLEQLEAEKDGLAQGARDQAQLLEREKAARVDVDRSIARLERENADAHAQIEIARDAADAATSERDQARSDAGQLKRQVGDLQQRLASEQTSSRALGEERSRSADRIAELELEVESAQQHLTAGRK